MYNLQKIILDKYVNENNDFVLSEINKADGTLVYQLESKFDDEGNALPYSYVTANSVDSEGYQKSLDLLQDAIDKINVNLINTIYYSDETELNDEYTLYHYAEEEIIVLVKTEEWEEIYQIMIDDDVITFEAL